MRKAGTRRVSTGSPPARSPAAVRKDGKRRNPIGAKRLTEVSESRKSGCVKLIEYTSGDMTFGAKPVELSPEAAARKAMYAVSRLDAMLDALRPTEAEVPPETPLGRAWSGLIGSVARATLRADELIEAVTPLYKRLGDDGRGPPPPGVHKTTLNGAPSGSIMPIDKRIDALADF